MDYPTALGASLAKARCTVILISSSDQRLISMIRQRCWVGDFSLGALSPLGAKRSQRVMVKSVRAKP